MKTKRAISGLKAFLLIACCYCLLPTSSKAQAPVANFSANPDSGCEPLVVNFTDSSTNAPTSWFWDFGDGTMDTIQNTVHFYLSGTYNIMLVVSNGFGSDTIIKSIVAYPGPTAGFTYNGDQCLTGNSYSFTNTGTPGVSYSWDFGTGGPISTFENPTWIYGFPGTFTVTQTVTDSLCSDVFSLTVAVFSEPTVSIVGTNVSCGGACDGAADLTVVGGASPYTYIWSSAVTTEDLTGLCAGIYSVTVTDVNGCSDTASVVISEPPAIALFMSSVDASCFGCCDGQATGIPSGGFAPYTYQWNDPGLQATQIATGLCAGTYCVTVTDATGFCIANNCVIVADTSCTINLTTITTQDNCNSCSGTAAVSPLNGTPPFTYLWSNLQNVDTITGLCAGTYTVEVTDSIGCSAIDTAMVAGSGAFTVTITSTDVTCNGDSTGSAIATPTGGIPPFSYSWIPTGGVDSIATGLMAATYAVTVIDSTGCDVSQLVTIGQPVTLATNIAPTNVSCNGVCDGVAYLTVAGGTVPYTYTWANGDSTQDISGLCVDTFVVIVTDSNLCIISDSVIITDPIALTVVINAVNKVSCNGECDGDATVTPSGGTTPYTYEWDDSSFQTTAIADSLCPGIYTVIVTDANGCIDVTAALVSEPPVLSVMISSITDAICGLCDGSATASPSGGTGPFSFFWNDPGAQTDSTAISLCGGIYTVQVTDSNGCFAVDTVVIADSGAFTVVITSTDAPCFGNCDGIAIAIPSGVPPYFFSWNTTPIQVTDTATGLCAGTYIVAVADSTFCTVYQSVTINQPLPIVTTITTTDATCGNCNGTAVAAPANGTPPYTFLWSNLQTTDTAIGLCAGNNIVAVTDSNGCSVTDTAVVAGSATFTLTISSTDVSCNGDSNGVATVTPIGGIAPFTYFWPFLTDPLAQTDSMADSLAPGVYTVIVTDSTGCFNATAAIISQPAALTATLSITGVGCAGPNDGSIIINPTGGVPGYVYSIDSGATWSAFSLFDSLAAGTYFVFVQDINGCETSDTAIIDTTAATPNITLAITNPTICGNYGYVSYSISGGTAPYTIQWGTQPYYWYYWSSIASFYPGTFTITATDANGCTGDTTFTIQSACLPNLITGSVFDDMNANCIMDSSDYGLSGWMVRADPGAVYAYTNNWGFYQLHLDSGNYTISLVDNDNIRSQVCPVSPLTYTLNLGSSPNTIDSIDFTVKPDFYCPDLSVDLIHIGYRPCFSSFYVVYYCNNGTGIAANAYIEIELPQEVTADTSITHPWIHPWTIVKPWTSQIGNVYTFDIGDLNPNECGNFRVYINISCNAVMNSTLCVKAHIYPDSNCAPVDSTWDRSSVAVAGSCVNDSLACFTIYNTGDPGTGDMQGTSQYRIYENNMLISTGTFLLAGGDSLVVCWPANGNTIRLEAGQRPGHPGNSYPQDNVEMCGGTPFITGQITQVPTDDADDFVDIECGPVVSSWDPNDKNVRPEGLTNTFHFIDSTDILEYKIRFQNTGTDTAFNIVLRDTLSPYVDITTIVPGASSHPYTLEIFGSDILQWTFSNVLLPDSNVNEPESHGFVKFKIHQKPGNALGTVIENDAGIIFDFNDPVITNKVFNIIGNIDSITTAINFQFSIFNIQLKVYPNPFNSTTTFEVTGLDVKGVFTFELYNIIGKKVKEVSNIANNKFVISRENLPEGIYIFKIRSKDGLIGAGKLMVN